SQAEHIPVHLGAMPESVKAALEQLPPDEWNEKDVVILNDPYEGGTHLPDITMIAPVIKNKTLSGFVANRAHHADIGGKVPGSMPGDSTEIFQEGLRIPPTKLVDEGTLNRGFWRLLLANVRTPDERQGDLRAQLAANTTGINRFQSIVMKYGTLAVTTFLQDLLSYSRKRMLKEISKMPIGDYSFTDYLDNDGITDEPVKISVIVTLSKRKVIFDFSNTVPQTQGNVNATYAVTLSTCYYVLRCVTDPTIPANAGCYEPLKVKAPLGSLLNPAPPAAVSAGNVETSQRIVDVLFGALAQALPDRIPAASQGTMNNLTIGGLFPKSHRSFAFYETIGGGLGARPNADGIDGIHSHMTNTANTPIEALETTYPLRVRCYKLISNSGGLGRYRGGYGIQRDIEILTDQAMVSIQSDRRHLAPWGLQGGKAGYRGTNGIWHNNRWEPLPSKVSITTHRGDVISIQTPGGGGFGKPVKQNKSSPRRSTTS
ncbi:MAG: hydantoinase B/oxoprolinase family protein, partial [Promethearchaeota archaeon]